VCVCVCTPNRQTDRQRCAHKRPVTHSRTLSSCLNTSDRRLCVCVCVCHRHMSLSHTYTQPLQITHGRWDGSTATDRLTMDAQLPHTTHTQTHTHAGTHTHTQREREREMQHGPSVDPRVIHPSIQRSIKVLKPYARGHAMYAAALQAMRQAGRQRTREPMIIQASIT